MAKPSRDPYTYGGGSGVRKTQLVFMLSYPPSHLPLGTCLQHVRWAVQVSLTSL